MSEQPPGAVQQYAPAPGYYPNNPSYPQGASYPPQAAGQMPPPGYGPPQPTQGGPQGPQWMPKPEIPDCPPGLEYLTQIDQILVHQAVQLLDAFTGFDCKNKFQVKNSLGQQIYYAAEESGFCERQICGSHRGFTMHIADNMGNEVLRATRQFKCCAGCCWFACANCCAYEIEVEAPVGQVIGFVRQSCSPWRPRFEVMDVDHQPILKLTGPFCICECPCFDVDFNVYTMDGEEVGRINKQWSGLAKELFTESDNFGVSFPMDLDVKAKATLLAGVFLVDMMYFAKNNQNNDNR